MSKPVSCWGWLSVIPLVASLICLGVAVLAFCFAPSATSSQHFPAQGGVFPTAAFVPISLSPKDNTLSGEIVITIPSDWVPKILDCSEGPCTVDASYADKSVRVAVPSRPTSLGGSGASVFTTASEPVWQIFAPTGAQLAPGVAVFTPNDHPSLAVPVALPVTGNQATFPEDQYRATFGLVRVSLGALTGFALRPTIVDRRLGDFELAATAITNEVSYDENTQTPIYVRTGFMMTLGRDHWSVTYTYVLCLLPFFAGVIGLLFFLTFRSFIGRDSTVAVLTLFLGSLFSILPLRFVIVPANVTTITKADYVLAADAGFVLFAAALILAVQTFRAPRFPLLYRVYWDI